LRILLANVFFDNYTGSEVVVRDLATAFRGLGHVPIVFATKIAKIAEELTAIGIQVTDDLATVSPAPDIIHGHHHRVLIEALLRFPDSPAISMCHDAASFMDEPFYHPRIRRYLAVDDRCRLRVERALGERAGEIGVMLNAVDMQRFQPRGQLPNKPARALLFSNYANRNTHLKAVKQACREAGLHLDVIGEGVGNQSSTPELDLPKYDLVFAKARCALEALAVGNAVVLCDSLGAGPYVTSAQLDHLRRLNFGRGLLTDPLNSRKIVEQIMRYDAEDALKVTQRIRAESSLEAAAADWVRLYGEVVEQFDVRSIRRETEYKCCADYIASWHYLKRKDWEHEQINRLRELPFVTEGMFELFLRLFRKWLK
jgi:hypothetical protein